MTARYQFTIYRPDDADEAGLHESLLALKDSPAFTDATYLGVDLAIAEGQSMNTRRDGAVLSAMVSVDIDIDAAPDGMLAVLRETGAEVEGYRVNQDVPRDYERDWALGSPSPGVRQLTLLRPKPDLTYAAFKEHWHGTHGPLAMRIHPIWRYDRNEVEEALGDDAAPLAGIVALHFRELEDVTDTLRMYGGDMANIQVIFRDVSSFIDMRTIVVAMMREHVLVASDGA